MRFRLSYGRAEYLLWALARSLVDRDRTCPNCSSRETTLVKRKALVTVLRSCTRCHLMFRTPKGDPMDLGRFYETAYRQGVVTEVPSSKELQDLLATGFKGSLQDFSVYMDVLRAAGVAPGGVVLDFGSSWGYGSWQLAREGYTVYSYELSPSRASFAECELGCDVVRDTSSIGQPVDCLFASHVIEHLPQPRDLWEVAEKVLGPDGVVVLFLPNGEPGRARLSPQAYHSVWGRVHPMLISPAALQWMATEHGFQGTAYSSPYQMDEIAAGTAGDTLGDELLFIAKRRAS